MYLGYIRLINQVSKKGWLDDYNNIYTVSTKNIRIEEIFVKKASLFRRK